MKVYLTILCCLFPIAVTAKDKPLVFQREILTIIPKNDTKGPTPETGRTQKEAENTQSEKASKQERQSFRFYTDMRTEQVLELDWIKSLRRVGPDRTMTITFTPPRYDVIYPNNSQQELDVLSITPQGEIVQIIPNLILAELNAPIETAEPVAARLILQGGAAETLDIRPGDRVSHPIFRPDPKILRK